MALLVGWALAVEVIPLGIIVSAVLDPSLQRRSRFSPRLAALVMIVVLPDLVLVGGFGLGEIGKAAFPLVMLGLLWGLMLVVLAPFLLFHEPGPNAGPSDSDGGPGPENRPPAPPLPVGWIPLPDAEQSPIRTRGPSRGRLSPHPRRSREPKPGPSRIRLLR